jgi:hypothetical protein
MLTFEFAIVNMAAYNCARLKNYWNPHKTIFTDPVTLAL